MTLGSDRVLKVAIVGSGNISRRHAEGYADTGQTRLVGVCDIVEAKAQALAETIPAPIRGLPQPARTCRATTPPSSTAWSTTW